MRPQTPMQERECRECNRTVVTLPSRQPVKKSPRYFTPRAWSTRYVTLFPPYNKDEGAATIGG